MESSEIKHILLSIGAELCGIASINSFTDAPYGFHPKDVFPECKSVITFAIRFPVVCGTLTNVETYTQARDSVTDECDRISLDLCCILEKRGIKCVPISTCDAIYDECSGRWRSKVSIKHAAVLGGIGTIGKHSLVISSEFGCMMWLGCVLCDTELDIDPIKPSICENCNKCVEACPVGALESELMEQTKCEAFAYKEEGIVCHRCRDACPYNFGILNNSDREIAYQVH